MYISQKQFTSSFLLIADHNSTKSAHTLRQALASWSQQYKVCSHSQTGPGKLITTVQTLLTLSDRLWQTDHNSTKSAHTLRQALASWSQQYKLCSHSQTGPGKLITTVQSLLTLSDRLWEADHNRTKSAHTLWQALASWFNRTNSAHTLWQALTSWFNRINSAHTLRQALASWSQQNKLCSHSQTGSGKLIQQNKVCSHSQTGSGKLITTEQSLLTLSDRLWQADYNRKKSAHTLRQALARWSQQNKVCSHSQTGSDKLITIEQTLLTLSDRPWQADHNSTKSAHTLRQALASWFNRTNSAHTLWEALAGWFNGTKSAHTLWQALASWFNRTNSAHTLWQALASWFNRTNSAHTLWQALAGWFNGTKSAHTLWQAPWPCPLRPIIVIICPICLSNWHVRHN